jgi:UDP-2,3-diacylglucosamine pyrophosphatase LpxH
MEEATHWYRSIWISDIHLGTRGCKAEYLLDFLQHTASEYLYLVGDIIDGWQLSRSGHWSPSHNEVVRKLLRAAREGTRVTYIPGNHDEMFRDFTDMHFGGVAVANETVHEMADGRKFLVIHGDQFDGVTMHAKWLALLGDWAYDQALLLNAGFNYVRRKLGFPYWSLSAYLKHKVKNAVNFISDFEHAVSEEARRRGVDGVICGHIHKAEMRRIGEVLYCNDGDWVESCTALVEDKNGKLEIVHWAAQRAMEAEQARGANGRARVA